VLEFISFDETRLTATDGAALGLTSTDIGVAEAVPAPAGGSVSLQRAGVGSSQHHFSWAPPAAATFGASNVDQTFVPLCPPSLPPSAPPSPPLAPPPEGGLRGLPTQLGQLTQLTGLKLDHGALRGTLPTQLRVRVRVRVRVK